jgi:hypothetical protein
MLTLAQIEPVSLSSTLDLQLFVSLAKIHKVTKVTPRPPFLHTLQVVHLTLPVAQMRGNRPGQLLTVGWLRINTAENPQWTEMSQEKDYTFMVFQHLAKPHTLRLPGEYPWLGPARDFQPQGVFTYTEICSTCSKCIDLTSSQKFDFLGSLWDPSQAPPGDPSRAPRPWGPGVCAHFWLHPKSTKFWQTRKITNGQGAARRIHPLGVYIMMHHSIVGGTGSTIAVI